MQSIEYKAKVLNDGHLSCPDNVKQQLHLTNGSTVKVVVVTAVKGKISKLKGIWQGVKITADDIDVARQEMWGRLEKAI